MGTDFPLDIIREILLKLSPKSLIRFKAVCKHWLGLITSSDFIGTHSQRRPRQMVMLTLSRNHFKTRHGISLLSDPTLSSGSDLRHNRSIPSKFKLDKYGTTGAIVDSCNGLICLSTNSINDYFLWNPATGESRLLPSPQFPAFGFDRISNGFGFHHETNDYKIMRTVENRCSLHAGSWRENPNPIIKAEFFALSIGSWTEIKDPNIPLDIEGIRNWVVVKGVWYRRVIRNRVWYLVMFDVGDNLFSVTEYTLPDDQNMLYDGRWMMEYKGLLATLLQRRVGERTWTVELWTMRNDNYRWTKLLACGQPEPIANPLPVGRFYYQDIMFFFEETQEIILKKSNEFCFRLYSFNLTTQEWKLLGKRKKATRYGCAQNYVESLVSVYATRSTPHHQLVDYP